MGSLSTRPHLHFQSANLLIKTKRIVGADEPSGKLWIRKLDLFKSCQRSKISNKIGEDSNLLPLNQIII